MKYISSLIVFCSLFVFSSPVFAAESECKPLYGGGVTNETVCEGEKVVAPDKAATTPKAEKPTPAPQKATPAPKKAAPTPTLPPTTKGGLPVLTPAPQQNTPSTGPESLGIIALAYAGAIGYCLRKKT